MALTILLLTVFFTSQGKVSFIFIKTEVDSTKIIRTVRVYGYIGDSIMLFGPVNAKDTFQVACKSKVETENLRNILLASRHMMPVELIGKWPNAGDTVLMVVEEYPCILFARKTGHQYRFWNPYGFGPIFMIDKPFRKLKKSKYYTSADGCIVNARYIKERGHLMESFSL